MNMTHDFPSEAEHEFWRDRPCLITGATGFLGSWLAARMVEADASVVCFVRDWVPHCELVRQGLFEKVTVVRGDVRDQDAMEAAIGEYEIDTVIHLAAQAIVGIANRNPVFTFDTNIRGTWSVLEACRRSPTVRQIVVASSDKAYGDCETLPYNETTPLQGRHPYDASKSCADLIAQSYAGTFDMPVVVARCGNFFGGGDLNWNRIVPGTIRSVLKGEPPVIRSDGMYIRDYLYVEDGAAAYMQMVEKLAEQPELAGEAFNFSTESKVTVLELVRQILDVMGSDLKPDIRDEARNEILHQFLDSAKARRILGWEPSFGLDEGLRKSAEWYTAFLKQDRNRLIYPNHCR
jgi:CDP-glucose 4,6-dehydratase